MPAYNINVIQRFWDKVNKSGPTIRPELGPCWIWTAQINNKGYGCFRLSRPRRMVYAHRYAWELANGPIPEGVDILHECDNPPCVRHLFPGDAHLNALDKAAKGRTNTTKLSHAQIEAIRQYVKGHQSYGLTKYLAEKFNVHRSTIRRAAKLETFKLL